MKIWFEGGRLFCQKFFKKRQLAPGELDSVVVTEDGTRVKFRDGRKELFSEEKLEKYIKECVIDYNFKPES